MYKRKKVAQWFFEKTFLSCLDGKIGKLHSLNLNVARVTLAPDNGATGKRFPSWPVNDERSADYVGESVQFDHPIALLHLARSIHTLKRLNLTNKPRCSMFLVSKNNEFEGYQTFQIKKS